MKKCYCCGADVPDESKFCPKCGKAMTVTQDLIDRAKAGDSDAQAELYERTYKTVYSRIRAKVPDTDTVMDIMQKTYRCAFTSLDQLQEAEAFPSWILTIANRQVCDWYRKNGKEQQNVQISQPESENDDTAPDEDDLSEIPEFPEGFSPDEPPDRAETGRLLSEILNTLPEDQRIILIMRYYDEMSIQEILEDLGVDLNTVQSRLSAGKKNVEEKVLDLEKTGTDLYSLSPIAFLVYLLHHSELFAPAIPANTVIGSAANDTADAGGAAAGHGAADTAAETSAPAAAKRINLKVVAIIAAAVIVVGGGTTAAVIATNNSREASDTAAAETSQDIIGLNPDETTTEEAETEPEPSEETGETDGAEEVPETETETPAENTEQQEPEPSASEEIQEEPVVLPSEDVVMNLADAVVPIWGSSAVENYSGQINLNTNQAVEMATILAYWYPHFYPTNGENYESYYPDEKYTAYGYTYDLVVDIIPASTVQTFMTKLFGSQFQLSGYTNSDYDSAFETSIPGFKNSVGQTVSRNDNGDFEVTSIVWDESLMGGNISVESITPTGTNSCVAVIQFDNMDYEIFRGKHTMSFGLVEDPTAEYGWAITSITLNG